MTTTKLLKSLLITALLASIHRPRSRTTAHRDCAGRRQADRLVQHGQLPLCPEKPTGPLRTGQYQVIIACSNWP